MRVLHFVKTSAGGLWAAQQAATQIELGLDVHALVPRGEGVAQTEWRSGGVTLHSLSASSGGNRDVLSIRTLQVIRDIVDEVRPDVIHSHFLSCALAVRAALRGGFGCPRIFQVPGPLHLESSYLRALDVWSATSNDYWIASSQYVKQLYLNAGAAGDRVFLSYYGLRYDGFMQERTGILRRAYGIDDAAQVVGSICQIYPPKLVVGQLVGLKNHEVLIDAVQLARLKEPRIVGLFVGGQFGGGSWYLDRLRSRAQRNGAGGVILPGAVAATTAAEGWPDYDCVVHCPLSENCGGVVEPMICGVPTLAANVGGLGEVVKDGVTGMLLKDSAVETIAEGILAVLKQRREYAAMARRGGAAARSLFDVRRTAKEVVSLYNVITGRTTEQPAEASMYGQLAVSADCRVY